MGDHILSAVNAEGIKQLWFISLSQKRKKHTVKSKEAIQGFN